LKEVIVNALVHRGYRMAWNIEIVVTSSSIKISNPGGLVEEVQHRFETGSIETEIRRGGRCGIKGYLRGYKQWPQFSPARKPRRFNTQRKNGRWDCLACLRRSGAYEGTGGDGRGATQRGSLESGSLPPPCPSA
jgi:hypothetical protein